MADTERRQRDDLSPASIAAVCAAQAARSAHAPAIEAPGRVPLTYARLWQHVEHTRDVLATHGLGPGDAVAIVLPHGAEMATACVGVAAAASAAPLNPLATAHEYDTAFTALAARALVVDARSKSAAVAVARARGLAVITLHVDSTGEAGAFHLDRGCRGRDLAAAQPAPHDVALLLPTSGSTGQSKIVPLTHSNLCYETRNIVAALQFATDARCLLLAPLFHVLGVVTNLLATVVAGGSVYCPPALDPVKLLEWIDVSRPTWLGVVPTIHQTLLAQSRRHPDLTRRHTMRFLLTGGAVTPPHVFDEIEQQFGVPLVEGYGLSEGAGMSTCNPLPPGERRVGSAGVALGQEVGIMDAAGSLLPPGETGEIVLRGPNVMAGYRDAPEVNARVFTNGWFRTGDLGRLDGDGYLWLSGRLKELINRGGEKVAPYEIDQALVQHPAVEQAVAFSVPDRRLGEDVAAAVVLRPDADVSERELRAFVGKRLAYFKVPRRILVVETIPKGPSGKLQRMGLAQQLGITERGAPPRLHEYVAPRTPAEQTLATLMAEVLDVERIGLRDSFLDLGGDSLIAVTLLDRIETTFGRSLSIVSLFEGGTIEELALELSAAAASVTSASLLPIQTKGTPPAFFCVHGMGGDVFHFRHLAHHVGTDIPFYGLRIRGVDGRAAIPTSIEEMAAHCIETVRAVQPHGPYLIGGYSFGGVVAFEMACRLVALGEAVTLLALLDAINPALMRYDLSPRAARMLWEGMQRRGRRALRSRWLWERLKRRVLLRSPGAARLWARVATVRENYETRSEVISDLAEVAARRYRPTGCYPGRITLFRTQQHLQQTRDPELGWGGCAQLGVAAIDVPGSHFQMVYEPYVIALARALRGYLEAARAAAPASVDAARVAARR